MPLELLQNSLRIQTRVGIVKSGNEAQRNDVVLASVNPSAAIFARSQRPSHRINDFAGLNPTRRNFPQLLNSLAIGLRIAIFHQIKFLNDLLGQRAARPFGKNHNLRLQIVSRLKVRLRLVLLVESFVISTNASNAKPGGDARRATIITKEQL